MRTSEGRFLVLGCGHTGTTLVSGILHINGYRSFKVSRDFESIDVVRLNQRILDGAEVTEAEIRAFVADIEKRRRGKWSLKDPRLSETVGRFYPYIREPVKIIANYRHPGATVRSLIRDRQIYESHLTDEQMFNSAQDEWLRRNRAMLRFLDNENRSPVLIVDYDQLVDRKLDEVLCRFVGHPLDLSFIEPTKRHSTPMAVEQDLLDLYEDLHVRFEANNRDVLRTTTWIPVPTPRGPTLRTRFYVASNRIANGVRWRQERIHRFVKTRGTMSARSRHE